MPVSYTIEKGYARCPATGNYSFDETFNNYKAALDDPLFLSGYNLLIDIYDSIETRTYEEMDQIADLLALHPEFGKKCAILVNPEHAVSYGLARMFGTQAEMQAIHFAIFSNLDEAVTLQWEHNPP